MLLRGQSLLQIVKQGEQQAKTLTDRQWFYLMLGSLALAPFGFGALAGWTYSLMNNPMIYTRIAFVLAVALSLLSWFSRLPGRIEKIWMNFLVAIDFGLLIPWLAG
jgi:hypothetical protein